MMGRRTSNKTELLQEETALRELQPGEIDFEKLREYLKQDLMNTFHGELGGWPGVAYNCICNGTPNYLVTMAHDEGIDLEQFRVR